MTNKKPRTTPATILMAQIRRAKAKVLKDKDYASAVALQVLQRKHRDVKTLRIVDEDYEEPDYYEKVG